MDAVTGDVLAFLGGALFVGITMYLAAKYQLSLPTSVPQLPLIAITFIANLLPFALLTYGFAGDFINQEFRLSAPSIGAFLAMLIVGLGGQAYAGTQGVDLSAQDTSGLLWCTIPGMENAESPWIPTAFISTATIAFYYLFWAWHTNRAYRGMIQGFFCVLVVQLIAFALGGCSASYIPLVGNGTINILLAIVFGFATALITYLSTSLAGGLKYDPFPTSTTAGGAGGSGGGSGGNSTGGFGGYGTACPPGQQKTERQFCVSCPSTCVVVGEKCVCDDNSPGRGPGRGTSQQVQDTENTFVAELYKNGQLVTDSIAA
jgi:hypothetical protein